MKKILLSSAFLFIFSLVTHAAHAVLPATTYTSDCWQGACTYQMYAVEGDEIALLIEQTHFHDSQYDEAVLRAMVNRYDQGWREYADMTGRRPGWWKSHTTSSGRRLATIAVIPAEEMACSSQQRKAYACGYLSATGIEIGEASFFSDIYRDLAARGELDPVLFYEMGRNYWFYSENFSGDAHDGNEIGFATGYAVFMREEISQRIGSPMPADDIAILERTNSIFDLYLQDAGSTWDTVFLGRDYPTTASGYTPDGPVMVATMLNRFKQQFGDGFFDDFYKHVGEYRGQTFDQNDKLVETLFKSASDAADQNLHQTFLQWKLPVPALASYYQPGSGFIRRANYQSDWLYQEWNALDVGNAYEFVITARRTDNGQQSEFRRVSSGATDRGDFLYLYFHKNELCEGLGDTANYDLQSIRIQSTENASYVSQYEIGDYLECVPPTTINMNVTGLAAYGVIKVNGIDVCNVSTPYGELTCSTTVQTPTASVTFQRHAGFPSVFFSGCDGSGNYDTTCEMALEGGQRTIGVYVIDIGGVVGP